MARKLSLEILHSRRLLCGSTEFDRVFAEPGVPLEIPSSHLLANDWADPACGGQLTIVSVSSSPHGGQVELQGDKIVYLAHASATVAEDYFVYTVQVTPNWTMSGSVVVSLKHSDLVPVDATTYDNRNYLFDYEVVGEPAGEFAIQLYTSANETFDASDKAVGNAEIQSAEPENIDPTSPRQYGGIISLDNYVDLKPDARFVIARFDSDDVIPESNEDNNSMFVIPLVLQDSRAYFEAGEASLQGSLREHQVIDTTDFRLHDRDDLRKIESKWGKVQTDNPNEFPGLKTIKNEEIWRDNPTPKFDLDDAFAAPELEAPLKKLSDLIGEASARLELDESQGLWITELFDRNGEHSNSSTHYEGRAVDIGLFNPRDSRADVLERVAGLAFLAGFDWTWNEGSGDRQHVHASVRDATPDTYSVSDLREALAYASGEGFVPSDETFNNLDSRLSSMQSLLAGRAYAALEVSELRDFHEQLKDFIEEAKEAERTGQLLHVFGFEPRTNQADREGLLSFNASKLLELIVPPSPYHNSPNQYDATNDGFVTPLDAFVVIDDLNRLGARSVDQSPPADFVDTNGDFYVTPLDALLIINDLNSAAGEGELVDSLFDDSLLDDIRRRWTWSDK